MDGSLGCFRSRYAVLKHSLGNIRFGSFAWELSPGIFRLISSVRDASLGGFRL